MPRQVAVTFPSASISASTTARSSPDSTTRARIRSGAPRGVGLLQPDVEVGGHRAGKRAFSRLLHQMDRRRPVAVAVEEGPANSAVQNPVEREVVRLGRPIGDELVPPLEAPDVQPLLVRRAAAEAAVLRGERLLKALHRSAPVFRAGAACGVTARQLSPLFPDRKTPPASVVT